MSDSSEIAVLQERVRALEEKIQALRASRRVLMSLISVQERSVRAKISQLEQENKRLHERNVRFAQAMLEKNARLLRLQQQPQPWPEAADLPQPNLTGDGSA